jgi:hypothetical protein
VLHGVSDDGGIVKRCASLREQVLISPMRSFAFLLLCLCLALSGTAAATPMSGVKMESMVETASMDVDCADTTDVASVPSGHHASTPFDESKPNCCKAGACQCANAHCAFVTVAPVLRDRLAPMGTSVVAVSDTRYSSPALARLVRPPISR